jgi:hypothetical protein
MKYFLFLKTKQGDFNTIKNLNTNNMNIVPVFDLTAKEHKNSSSDILKKQIAFCKNIKKFWAPKKPFYIDHNDIALTLRHDDGSHPYGFYQSLLSSGFNLGVVTGIDRDDAYQVEIVNTLSKFDNVRVLIRLHINDIYAIRITINEIKSLYSSLIKKTHFVDFVIDNRIVTAGNITNHIEKIKRFILEIEKMKIDALIVIASSSFPPSIKEYVDTGSIESIPIFELELWEKIYITETNYVSLTYGDYGVVSPDFIEIETNGKGPIPIVPKVIYTTHGEYIVNRGKKTSQHSRGFKQYKDIAEYFVNLPVFRTDFSFGERYMSAISDMSNDRTGNPTTWITACMSQHVNFIYEIID